MDTKLLSVALGGGLLLSAALPAAALAQQGGPPPGAGPGSPGGPIATDLQCTGCVDSTDIQDGAVTADKLAQDVLDSLSDILADLDLLDDLNGLSEKTVFVTSRSYTGNLGGLAGADFICQQHADGAGLAGRFKAWLSDGSWSPSTRFAQSTVPYVLPDAGGTIVAEDYQDLTDGDLDSPINVNENGDPVEIVPVWTGTDDGGDATSNHCQGWTTNSGGSLATFGSSGVTHVGWTSASNRFCSDPSHLFCFEQ